MKDMARLLEKWQLNVGDVREQMYRAPTPRERERWQVAGRPRNGPMVVGPRVVGHSSG